MTLLTSCTRGSSDKSVGAWTGIAGIRSALWKPSGASGLYIRSGRVVVWVFEASINSKTLIYFELPEELAHHHFRYR